MMLACPLAACSVATAGGKAVSALPYSRSPASAPGSHAGATGRVSVPTVPAGATPWKENTGTPMQLNAFVHRFYVQNSWSGEEGRFKQRGFMSGAVQGWINTDGSQQSLTIMGFSSSTGALSEFNDLTSTFRDKPKPATVVTDDTDGAVGTVNPTPDSLGNALVDMTAHVGDYVIDVHEYTAGTPDPAAAKALLLKQYNSLNSGT
jgi:hypothetical protein